MQKIRWSKRTYKECSWEVIWFKVSRIWFGIQRLSEDIEKMNIITQEGFDHHIENTHGYG